MSDAVDSVIVEREAMDQGLGGGLGLSVVVHVLVAGLAVASHYFAPSVPPLRVAFGNLVPIPAGGGGKPNAAEAAPAAPAAKPAPQTTAAPKPEPPAKVAKPPKEEPRKGVPELNPKKKPPKTSPPAAGRPGPTDPRAASASSTAGGRGTSSETPGLEFAPAGPGAPGGFGTEGDWYLASVQRKIWMIWGRQLRAGFQQSVTVRFTILADGSVADVGVVTSSGVSSLDFAATRAVYSAAPFNPLPKDYGTNRFTIQALFKPLQ